MWSNFKLPRLTQLGTVCSLVEWGIIKEIIEHYIYISFLGSGLGGCHFLNSVTLSRSVILTHGYHDLCVQSVAYDRSSAPKDFQIRGWYQGTHDDSDKDSSVMATLGEFSYSLDSSNAQTFQLERSANPQAVNMVRFDFSSNHGNLELTCIYRFRVHGTEPGSLSNTAWCPDLSCTPEL
jgi:hypothetical protein